MRHFGSDLYAEWIIAVAILSALIALPLAMGITLALVRLFRVRVERSMRATIGGPVNPESHRAALGGPQGDLVIDRIEATRKQASAACAAPMLANARRHARQLAAIYAGAACAYPLISAAAVIGGRSPPVGGSAPVQQVMLTSAAVYGLAFLQLATPVVLAPTMVLTRQPRFLILAALIFLILLWVVGSSVDARMYVILWILAVVPILAILVTIVLKSQPRLLILLALALIAALGLSASGWSTASHTHVVGLWALVAGVPTAAVLLLNTRRLRAVGPVVFAATLLLLYGIGAGFGYMAFYVGDAIGPVRLVHGDLAQLPLVDAARQYFREMSGLPLREMPAAMSAYLHALRAENPEGLTLTVKLNDAIWFAGTALGTLAGSAIIRWLADNYKRRRASDQMLMIDVMMVVFIVPTAVFRFFYLAGLPLLACRPASRATSSLHAGAYNAGTGPHPRSCPEHSCCFAFSASTGARSGCSRI